MGKGSTKNEKKVNAQRVEVAKARETQARKELAELKKRPQHQRPENYAQQIKVLEGILKKSIDQRRRSPNHTQNGKRGSR